MEDDEEEEKREEVKECVTIAKIREKLSETPEGALDLIKEAIQRTIDGAKKEPVAKPVKCTNEHTMHLMTQPKPREASNGDFLMGEQISCKVCSQPINVYEGFYSCMDVCDFDVHPKCYGGQAYQEKEMTCPYNHAISKR